MTRRWLTACLVASIATGSVTADAQPTGKVARIGFLAFVPDGVPVFRQAMSELGYVEGRNLKLEVRIAEGRPQQLPDLAAQLVREGVDVVLASSPPAIRAAKEATATIPIVMGFGHDPEKAGFVSRLARPGGNVTGVALLTDELAGKRLGMLKELVPGTKRVALLALDDAQVSGLQIAKAQHAAQLLGVDLVLLRVSGPRDYEGAIAEAGRSTQGILMLSNPLFMRDRRLIADLAAKHRLPMVCDWEELVQAGCLMAYGPSMLGLMRRAASFVHRILQGANPAELAVEQPDTFDLTINSDTVTRLGITVPAALRLQARTLP